MSDLYKPGSGLGPHLVLDLFVASFQECVPVSYQGEAFLYELFGLLVRFRLARLGTVEELAKVLVDEEQNSRGTFTAFSSLTARTAGFENLNVLEPPNTIECPCERAFTEYSVRTSRRA
jgi:hypothetical protein